MFKSDTKQIISSLVDQFLNRKEYRLNPKNSSIVKEAMVFNLNLSVYDRKSQNQFRTNIKMLFAGNTSVFFTTNNNIIIEDIPYTDWNNTSNHDSCWRTDGFSFLDNLYFEMCHEINEDIAPIYLGSEISFGYGNLFEKIFVEIKKEEDDNCKYKIINMNRDISNISKDKEDSKWAMFQLYKPKSNR